MNKISLSRKEQYLINVERLLSCVGMLSNKADHMHLEWYPKELRDSISKFMYNDIHDVIRDLVTWVEDNTCEEAYDEDVN